MVHEVFNVFFGNVIAAHLKPYSSKAAPPGRRSGMTPLIMACGIDLPMEPLACYFKLQSPPWPYFVRLGGILFSFILLTLLMKRYDICRFGCQ